MKTRLRFCSGVWMGDGWMGDGMEEQEPRSVLRCVLSMFHGWVSEMTVRGGLISFTTKVLFPL